MGGGEVPTLKGDLAKKITVNSPQSSLRGTLVEKSTLLSKETPEVSKTHVLTSGIRLTQRDSGKEIWFLELSVPVTKSC
jgi:hypothetical protein